jgi:heme-degrading monooxygenase HmoA
MEYVEIAKFKLKEGITDEQFIEAEKNVRNGIAPTTKGYKGRELYKDDKNEWVIILRYETKEDMDAWFVAMKQDPSMKVYGSMIDFPSMRMEFFNKKM